MQAMNPQDPGYAHDQTTGSASAAGSNPGSGDGTATGPRFWSKLKSVIAWLPWTQDLLAAYFCATDPATPPRAKATLLAALGYFVVPLDAVPDFFAAAGYADDLAVLLLAIRTVQNHLTPAHREMAARKLAAMKETP